VTPRLLAFALLSAARHGAALTPLHQR
jgi:hypothetical protein